MDGEWLWASNGRIVSPAHFEPSESILNDFHDFSHFAIVSDALMLFPEDPRTLRKCPKGPGTLSEGPGILREGVMVV